MEPFVALTDKAWFDYLRGIAVDGRVDEVNFWSPKSVRPIKKFTPGEPVFFRLKKPWFAIAGYGFFAHFSSLGLREAWDYFGRKNGDPDEASFRDRLGRYRGVNLADPRAPEAPLGCTVLRDAHFWPDSQWISWGHEQGWFTNTVRGATVNDPGHAMNLLDRVVQDARLVETRAEWEPSFHLVQADERRFREARARTREGQGTFRTRLLDAYGRRCAVTGERTEPVLDAAHIQPYLGPASNHVQNGLLLTKEFHTLFDAGFVTVTPDHEVRVSAALRDRWSNGKRYYEYDGRRLTSLPRTEGERPSSDALLWHTEHVFKG
jgi:putative restriction endonuclease